VFSALSMDLLQLLRTPITMQAAAAMATVAVAMVGMQAMTHPLAFNGL
jgi:hypothetical protein